MSGTRTIQDVLDELDRLDLSKLNKHLEEMTKSMPLPKEIDAFKVTLANVLKSLTTGVAATQWAESLLQALPNNYPYKKGMLEKLFVLNDIFHKYKFEFKNSLGNEAVYLNELWQGIDTKMNAIPALELKTMLQSVINEYTLSKSQRSGFSKFFKKSFNLGKLKDLQKKVKDLKDPTEIINHFEAFYAERYESWQKKNGWTGNGYTGYIEYLNSNPFDSEAARGVGLMLAEIYKQPGFQSIKASLAELRGNSRADFSDTLQSALTPLAPQQTRRQQQ